ncbi:hypothetical protein, partial [Cecembia rubra]|uniref:hypothetical protein n=1 Tax=Cecembia rubra TaxID=1485585 RepID=UPI0027153F34
MHKYLLFVFFFLILMGVSCSQKKEPEVNKLRFYPNEDAPLALLMREMFKDMEDMRNAIENGDEIRSYLKKHGELLHAKPTNPEVKTTTFELMGNAYLESLKILEESPQALLKDNYRLVVQTCLACHQQYCPGPIKRIN